MIGTGPSGDKSRGLTLPLRMRVTDNSGGALASRQGEAFQAGQPIGGGTR